MCKGQRAGSGQNERVRLTWVGEETSGRRLELTTSELPQASMALNPLVSPARVQVRRATRDDTLADLAHGN